MPQNWILDEGKWNRAAKLAKDQGHENDYDYITALYKKMGGRKRGGWGKKMTKKSQLAEWSDVVLVKGKKMTKKSQLAEWSDVVLVKGKKAQVGEVRTRRDGSKWKKTARGWVREGSARYYEHKEDERAKKWQKIDGGYRSAPDTKPVATHWLGRNQEAKIVEWHNPEAGVRSGYKGGDAPADSAKVFEVFVHGKHVSTHGYLDVAKKAARKRMTAKKSALGSWAGEVLEKSSHYAKVVVEAKIRKCMHEKWSYYPTKASEHTPERCAQEVVDTAVIYLAGEKETAAALKSYVSKYGMAAMLSVARAADAMYRSAHNDKVKEAADAVTEAKASAFAAVNGTGPRGY